MVCRKCFKIPDLLLAGRKRHPSLLAGSCRRKNTFVGCKPCSETLESWKHFKMFVFVKYVYMESLDLGDYFIYILYFPNTLHLTTACNSRGRPLLPSCVLGARTRATCSRKAAGPPHLRILISSWCANFVVLRSCSVQNLRTTSCSCRHCWKIRLLG